MPGIALGARVTVEGGTDTVPALTDHMNYSKSWEGTDINLKKITKITLSSTLK